MRKYRIFVLVQIADNNDGSQWFQILNEEFTEEILQSFFKKKKKKSIDRFVYSRFFLQNWLTNIDRLQRKKHRKYLKNDSNKFEKKKLKKKRMFFSLIFEFFFFRKLRRTIK